jgi:hypothetical protein
MQLQAVAGVPVLPWITVLGIEFIEPPIIVTPTYAVRVKRKW